MALNEREIDFTIPPNRYLTFDPNSWRDLFIERLDQTGYFTQAGADGSNLNIIADIIGITFSGLVYQLNKSVSSGSFSETDIYTAMNKMVKELGYSPIGHQSATTSFVMTAKDLSKGLYTIPRYSYIRVNGFNYSFNEDVVFMKSEDTISEELEKVSANRILFQGTWIEYAVKSAIGVENETITVTTPDNVIIDHNNIHVYVKTKGKWSQWDEVNSLYFSKACDEHYMKRFNSRRQYEIKFGDAINGAQLSEGDQVAIYFLQSDGELGEISSASLSNGRFTKYDTVRLREIINDTTVDSAQTIPNGGYLSFTNKRGSTPYAVPETVEEIRKNAPNVFRGQFRLVHGTDYESYITSNFSHFIQDVKAISNEEYMDSYTRYYDELGISPDKNNRQLLNQIRFSTSCNFNNVYMILVPKNEGYLGIGQKSTIKKKMRDEQTITADPIPIDPVYIHFDISVPSESFIKLEDSENSRLVLVKEDQSLRSSESILQEANEIIINFFKRSNNSLGQIVDFTQLVTNLSSLNGVKKIYSENVNTGGRIEGINLVRWNPVYNWDISSVNSNTRLENFMFPILDNPNNLINKLFVQDSSLQLVGI